MTNILEAICNIVENNNYNILSIYQGRNRANSVGYALEIFIKDSFANTLKETDESKRLEKYNYLFSWLGNQNNPPDIMIKGGDAIEVKKTQGQKSDIALNSSYPKSKLKSNSTMIINECRNCEDWEEKELIYCIGHTDDKKLKSLWMVYGNIYAANHKTYEIIKSKISVGINQIPTVEFNVTKELGRVNRVDPLGITNLRIRGMWQIQNPRKVFNYIHDDILDSTVVAIIPTEHYTLFPRESILRIESLKIKGFSISDKKVKNPNNPAKLIDCKLIMYNQDETEE